MEYKQFLGIPFRQVGSSRGMNCYELVEAYFKARGLPVRDLRMVDPLPPKEATEGLVRDAEGDWVEVVGEPHPEDVLLFRDDRYRAGVHVGILTDDKRVLQATATFGVVALPFRLQRDSLLRAYRHKCLV